MTTLLLPDLSQSGSPIEPNRFFDPDTCLLDLTTEFDYGAACIHPAWTVIGPLELGGRRHLEIACSECLAVDYVLDHPAHTSFLQR